MKLAMALSLEWLFGDPPNRWHPVAWFGRWAEWCEARLYTDSCGKGALAWAIAIALPMVVVGFGHGLLGWLFDAVLLWVTIGLRSLFAHVRAVFETDSISEVRQAVAKIVSRDTSSMSLENARRAALESLAENASDAVVAPLFWFMVLGAPAAALYRMANTLDAMWGYRNERYARFGWWAARVDDALNWMPARLTAWLMLCLGRSARWRQIKAQSATHTSPNAGLLEVALAFAADVRLGGPVVRDGRIEPRPEYGPVSARDASVAADDALPLVRRVLLLALLIAEGVTIAL